MDIEFQVGEEFPKVCIPLQGNVLRLLRDLEDKVCYYLRLSVTARAIRYFRFIR